MSGHNIYRQDTLILELAAIMTATERISTETNQLQARLGHIIMMLKVLKEASGEPGQTLTLDEILTTRVRK